MNRSIPKLLLILIALVFQHLQAQAQVQKGTVKGFIYTSDNQPVENVTVTIAGSGYGTVTNSSGYFELKVPEGSYRLALSHVGVQGKQYDIQVYAGKTVIIPNTIINANISSLKEVTVSGSKVNKFKFTRSDVVAKMPLDNLENPQSYTTVTKELLTEQTIFNADDAVKNAPGIQKLWAANGRSGDGGAYYTLRGFVTQSQLRNGIAGNVSNAADAINLERMEIIKGPSATLFGSTLTSYGGLINRVTKKPYDDFGAEVNYTGGNYGLNRGTLDLNTPLTAGKKLLLRLNTAYTSQGSFQDNAFGRTIVVDPSLTYKVNDRLSITADAELSYGRNAMNMIYFFPYGVPVSRLGANRADQLKIDYTKSYFNKDLTQLSRNTNFFASANYKISDEWRSQTSFSSVNSYSNGFGPYAYLMPGDSLDRQDQSTVNSKNHVIEVQENINGDFKIGKLRNRIVAGLDYLNTNSDQMFAYGPFDQVSATSSTFNYQNFNKETIDRLRANGTLALYPYPYMFKNTVYSAYVSDVLNLADNLIATAALRVDHFKNKGSYNPATNQTTGQYDQTAFSPKFGLVYQPVKGMVSLFSNYQNGFKNQNGTDFAGSSFKPEHANQVEGGVKLDLFNGKLSSTISYYDIKVKDILRTDIAHPQFSIQNGTQISKGFEAEVIANPLQGFNLIGGFSYNDSKYQNADADVEGLRPATAGSPYSANFWASYRFKQGKIKGLGAGFGGNYASDNKVVNSVSQGVFILPAYTVLNSGVFYEKSDYRISVTVNNLTDKHYYIGWSSVNAQMLRQFIASFTFRF